MGVLPARRVAAEAPRSGERPRPHARRERLRVPVTVCWQGPTDGTSETARPETGGFGCRQEWAMVSWHGRWPFAGVDRSGSVDQGDRQRPGPVRAPVGQHPDGGISAVAPPTKHSSGPDMGTAPDTHYPDFETFAAAGQGAPTWCRSTGGWSATLTPVSAFHKIDAGRCACLFESVMGGEKVGRYSFLATDPFLEIEAYGNRVTVNSPVGRVGRRGTRSWSRGSSSATTRWTSCAAAWRPSARPRLPGLPPFCSGAVGYAGYDTVRYCRAPAQRPGRRPPGARPGLRLLRPDGRLRQHLQDDHRRGHGAARADGSRGPTCRGPTTQACAAGRRAGRAAVARPCELCGRSTSEPEGEVHLAYQSNFTQEDFEAAVRKCVEYIRAGDIFQVVFSQRLEVPIRSHPFEIYRTLRVVNPSPFMFYVRTPSVTLVGSSPEVMVRVVDGQVTVRPLAGTRRRGDDRGGGPAPGRGAAGRPQGAGRARDAGRPGPQRRRPGLPVPHRRS